MPLRSRTAVAAGALVLLAVARLAATPVNRVVLRVNDRIVTLYDYELRLADRREQVTRSEATPEEKQRLHQEAPKMVMRDFLDENLLLSRAEQLDVEPSTEVLDNAVLHARRNWGIESDDQFREALQQTGMTAAQFRDRVKDTLMYQEVLDRDVMSLIKVGDEELQRYYREHPEEFEVATRLHLREMVVLESSGKPVAELERLAGELHAQLAAGKTLDELAAASSADGTTSGAIDLGWLEARELDPALAAAVAGLGPGAYAEAVKARGGWHITQLVEREEAHLRPYEEVRDALRAHQRQKRYQERLGSYMAELEAKAFISTNAPSAAQGFRRERAQVPGQDPLEALRTEAVAPPAPESEVPPATSPASPTPAPPPPPRSR